MKNKIIFLIGVLMMFSINQAQADMSIRPIPTYQIDVKQSKVYFGRNEMADSDAKTFIIFEESGYAKDKNHVYLSGVILPSIDPAQAHYLGYGRLKDNKYVYVANQIIPDADPNTYQVLAVKESSAYGKDKNVVYFNMQKKPLIDKDTIEPLNNKYAKDKNSVYFWGEKIDGSAGSSFVILSGDTGKDKNHVYYNNRIIADADPATFEVLNVDAKSNVYGARMQGYGYAKDKYHVYYSGEKIKGADVNSFKETTYGYATDKKHVYYLGRVVEHANPKTFVQPPYQPIQY